jgi:hypothetical protein
MAVTAFVLISVAESTTESTSVLNQTGGTGESVMAVTAWGLVSLSKTYLDRFLLLLLPRAFRFYDQVSDGSGLGT